MIDLNRDSVRLFVGSLNAFSGYNVPKLGVWYKVGFDQKEEKKKYEKKTFKTASFV
jgi:hypothetical protein